MAFLANFVLALPALVFWLLRILSFVVETGSSEKYFRLIAWIFVAPMSFIFLLPWLFIAVKYRHKRVCWLGLLFGISPSVCTTVEFNGFAWLTLWF